MIDSIKTMKIAIETYGKDVQTDMMIEEMSDLAKALLKHRRNPSAKILENIREEMADVEIMLDQMRMIYGNNSGYRTEKLLRLASASALRKTRPKVVWHQLHKIKGMVKDIMGNHDIKRGDIFYVYRHAVQQGSEQQTGRPAIIVSNDSCNKSSDVVEIVYLTTQPKMDLPTHVKIFSTSKASTALCEQITSIDKTRLGGFRGNCSKTEMQAIDVALAISLGIDLCAGENRQKEETDQRDGHRQVY